MIHCCVLCQLWHISNLHSNLSCISRQKQTYYPLSKTFRQMYMFFHCGDSQEGHMLTYVQLSCMGIDEEHIQPYRISPRMACAMVRLRDKKQHTWKESQVKLQGNIYWIRTISANFKMKTMDWNLNTFFFAHRKSNVLRNPTHHATGVFNILDSPATANRLIGLHKGFCPPREHYSQTDRETGRW